MSIVLSCWNSSCATLNLWGDLDTKFSNSGFPGKTASKLRLMKLILARPVSWTLLTHCFPYWRAIPAFCLFYWYVAFTKMGCYPGPDSGGFVALKAFSDVMKPRILIEGASTDFHLPEKPYVGNGTVYVCYLFLCHPSAVTGRDPLSAVWRGSEGSCWCMPWKTPFLPLPRYTAGCFRFFSASLWRSYFANLGAMLLLLIDEKSMMNKNFEKAVCREQVLRAQPSVWGFHFVWF